MGMFTATGGCMGLQQHRHYRRPGLPEFLALILVLAALFAVIEWWLSATTAQYRETQGHVLRCTQHATHYNATDLFPKVTIEYEYDVGLKTYMGSWEGSWPSIDSPNALPPDKVAETLTAGHSLVVLYDPDNPSQSLIHHPSAGSSRLYSIVAAFAGGIALVYLIFIYPNWKRRDYSFGAVTVR